MTSVGSSFGEVPCLKPSSNFNPSYFSSTTSSATTCLDLTDFSDPQLSFDLRQFRSSFLSTFGDDSLSAISSVMKLSYKDANVDYEDYIYGQEEGKKVFHKYNLQKGFKGKLTLSFYNNDGDSQFSTSRLAEVDAMLLDNLTIDNNTATNDASLTEFIIYPNPTYDHFTINTNIETSFTLFVLNSQGQVLKQFGNVQQNTKINVSDLVPGYYMIKCIDEKGSPSVMPFVKI